MTSSYNKILSLLILGCLLLAGCRSATPEATGQPGGTEAPGETPGAVAAFPATDTPQPTPTQAPARLILLAPPGSDAALAQALTPILEENAQANGLVVETLQELPAGPAGAEIKAVVVLPPDPGLAQLAPAAPETQFLAVGVPGIAPAGNVSLVGGGEQLSAQQAFMAGYLSAVITTDWRAGAVLLSGGADSAAIQTAFSNGLVFFCGLCRQAYPPFIQYPITVELPAQPGAEQVQTAVQALVSQAVSTVYLPAEVTTPELVEALSAAGLNLVGAATPQSAPSTWVATLEVDWSSGVSELLPRLLQGEGGLSAPAPLKLSAVNPDLLSPGRQQLVEEILAELAAGAIAAGAMEEAAP